MRLAPFDPTPNRRDAHPALTLTSFADLYLPWVGQDRVQWPDPIRTARFWAAVDAFAATHPLSELFPRYAVPPTAGAAAENVAHACADFPDLPEVFGEGAHRRACDVWVANSLALHHAIVARRLHRGEAAFSERPAPEHESWARLYFEITVDGMTDFMHGPRPEGEEGPVGRYRDTRAAVWQNPIRAADLGLLYQVMARDGLFDQRADSTLQSRTRSLLGDSAGAWQAHFPITPTLPAETHVLTTGVTAPGHRYADVVSSTPHVFRWNPDKGNSAIEEMAWMAAGARLGERLGDPRHTGALDPRSANLFLDFTFSAGRPVRPGGNPARTLNLETSGGAYGQNRLWIENHQPDMPSVPYLFSTWHYLSLATMAHEGNPALPWPALADPPTWRLVVAAGEATLHAPDGTFLVDLSPGGELGYRMQDHPAWTMPCGQWRSGAQYIEATTASGRNIYVSEVGHPAGTGILAAASPMIRLAAARGDQPTARLWAARADAALREITARPPDLATLGCKVAPWVSTDPAYHFGGMMTSLIVSALQAEGYVIQGRN
jgi:hypothetical protein